MTDKHLRISCNVCSAHNFAGQRFKCLCCSDYDLCQNCFESESISQQHEKKHPMQCILTSHDLNVYFEGGSDIFSSFTCPVCGQCGLCRVSLAQHLESSHAEEIASSQLMCPVCVVFSRTENRISDLHSHVRDDHNEQVDFNEMLKKSQESMISSVDGSSRELSDLLRRIERQRSGTRRYGSVSRSLNSVGADHQLAEDRRLAGIFRLMQRLPFSRHDSSAPSQRDESREFEELLRLINDREMREILNVNVHERIQNDLTRRRHHDEKRQRKISQYITGPQSALTRSLSNSATSSAALLDNCSLTEEEDTKKESGKLTKKKGSHSANELETNFEQGLLAGLCVEADSLDSGMTDAAELIMRRVFCQEIFYSSLSKDISSNGRDSCSYHEHEA